MDIKFALSESVKGVKRHLQMTAAVVVCVAVSLTMVGISWMLSQQVEHLKGYWYDRVEVSVFLCGNASEATVCPDGDVTDTELAAVRDALEGLPATERVYYESQEQAWERFQEQYSGSRVLSEVDASSMPQSFRVKLLDPTQFEVVANEVAAMDGVEKVQDQRKLLDGFFKLVSGLQTAALALAASQVLIAVLVVWATVRISVHARRKEVSVMRLVGASKAMIRAPFFGEALIAGGLGALLALGALAAFQKWVVVNLFASRSEISFVTWTDLAMMAPVLLVVGMFLPALATFGSLRKHLKV